MRLPLIAAAIAAASLVSACTPAMQEPAATASSRGDGPAISLETLKTMTQRLSSDEFEGRAPTTPGEEKTIRYIAERFQKAGLQPGNKGSWFQEVPLVEITSTPTPLSIGGGRQPLSFNYRADMVANSYQVQPRSSSPTARSSSSATASMRPNAAGTIMPESTCAARRWSSSSTIPIRDQDPRRPVRGTGDDLLWPLDLQI
jgi:hypothetical protein